MAVVWSVASNRCTPSLVSTHVSVPDVTANPGLAIDRRALTAPDVGSIRSRRLSMRQVATSMRSDPDSCRHLTGSFHEVTAAVAGSTPINELPSVPSTHNLPPAKGSRSWSNTLFTRTRLTGARDVGSTFTTSVAVSVVAQAHTDFPSVPIPWQY